MKTIVQNAIQNSISYAEYRKLVADLLAQNKATGNEQSEDLVHYSELNDVRMKRLDKTIVVTQEARNFLEKLNKKYIWLVITEGWCGDAAQILPVINKMAEVTVDIEMQIVLRDENEDLMNQFLTNGSKSIPKIIILEKETLNVLGDFGPRPTAASKLVSDYKTKHGIIDETIKTNLQKWYLEDKGISIQNEIIEMMN
jgi:hypothetical protein